MRGIKFRAWDTNNKGFVNGFNMFGFSTGQGAPNRKLQRFDHEWTIDDVILMQYLGLSDKNGKDIFEGDIVEEPYFSNVNPNDHDDEDYLDNTPRKHVICYDSRQAKYKMVPISTYLINAGNGGFTGYEVKYERISIIGNVCENSDLLK